MQTETAKNAVTSAYAVKRSYGYDHFGNLTHSTDQRTGTTHFEYDKLGRITKAGNEVFAFDPAHNILSNGLEEVTGFVRDGSHILQEVQPDGRYTYIYTNSDSYDPLCRYATGLIKKAKDANKPTLPL